MGILQKLSVDVGIRAGGTDGERLAADYLRDELTSWGYAAEEQPFPVQVYKPISTNLEETAPETKTLTPLPLTNAAPGQAEGEIAVVSGIGETGDFPASVAGRVALIQRGTITFTEKVQNAQSARAIGVIIYNNVPGNLQAPLAAPSTVPAVTVSQEEGQALLAAAQAGTVRVRMSIEATITANQSQNVLARAPGGDCLVLVGGHYDSVPAGPVPTTTVPDDGGDGDGAGAGGARRDSPRLLHVVRLRGAGASREPVLRLAAARRGPQSHRRHAELRHAAVGTDWPSVGTASLTALASQVANPLGIPGRASAEPPGSAATTRASSSWASRRSCSTASATSTTTRRWTSSSSSSRSGCRRRARSGWGMVEALRAEQISRIERGKTSHQLSG